MIMKELVKIQTELKANKDLFNKFGQFGYRSTETILEALKPLLKELGCAVTLSDSIVEVGQPYTYHAESKANGKESKSDYAGTRVYVEAQATLINKDGGTISVKAYAREDIDKAGMDFSQVTGSASSYARKYALCGLFAIDDGRDSDSANAGQVVDEDKLRSEFTTVKKKLDSCKKKQDVVDLNAKHQKLWGYQPYVQYRDMKYNQLPQ